MNVGNIYKISDLWDKDCRNIHIKKVYPDLKNGTEIEIIETVIRDGTKGATLIKIVETGQICNIREVNCYWCFFVESDIFLKQLVLVKRNNLFDHINAVKLISTEFDTTVASIDEIQKNLYSIDKIRKNLDWMEKELIDRMVKMK